MYPTKKAIVLLPFLFIFNYAFYSLFLVNKRHNDKSVCIMRTLCMLLVSYQQLNQ